MQGSALSQFGHSVCVFSFQTGSLKEKLSELLNFVIRQENTTITNDCFYYSGKFCVVAPAVVRSSVAMDANVSGLIQESKKPKKSGKTLSCQATRIPRRLTFTHQGE